MTIDERLVQLLVPGTIASLYPLKAPDQAATPYTTYLLLGDPLSMATMSDTAGTTRQWRVQLTSWSERYSTARQQGIAIKNALVGFMDTGISGIVPLSERGVFDDLAQCYGWLLELQIMEHLS